jgi:hypothetical protein
MIQKPGLLKAYEFRVDIVKNHLDIFIRFENSSADKTLNNFYDLKIG